MCSEYAGISIKLPKAGTIIRSLHIIMFPLDRVLPPCLLTPCDSAPQNTLSYDARDQNLLLT